MPVEPFNTAIKQELVRNGQNPVNTFISKGFGKDQNDALLIWLWFFLFEIKSSTPYENKKKSKKISN